MMQIKSILILLLSMSILYTNNCTKHSLNEFDKKHFEVAVYGATPGGIAAAVNAAREGLSVVLLQDDNHIGGLASGGLSNPDFKSFESLGGTYREFMQGVERYYINVYGNQSDQVINSVKGAYAEPHVARLVFERMLNDAGVKVLLKHRLISVKIKRIAGRSRPVNANFLNLETGKNISIEAKIFIDGTYEGDFIAASGVPYRIGRESQEEYNEELAPAQGDRLVQAYNFRVVLTTDSLNQIPIKRPENYDRSSYELLIKYLKDRNIRTIDEISRYVLRVRRMPNNKAEFNDVRTAPISLSRTEINSQWPDGNYKVRSKIFQQYKEWSLGLFYFLQNDPEVPVEVRRVMNEWALPTDEYVNNGNWTPALYVREARRMIGSYVYTEHDTNLEPNSVRSVLQERSVAISDYSINTHGVWRPTGGEHKGVIGSSIKPIQIPYDIMLPKETDGLLVPVAVSASHVGFAALRYEPAWTALGQAAGIAAAQALSDEVSLADIDIRKLQLKLHGLGAMTIYVSDLGEPTEVIRPDWEQPADDFKIWLNYVPPLSPHFRPIQFFGTLGFFHHIVDPDSANNWNRGHATGQWSLRMPYHAIEEEKIIKRSLANDWLKMAVDMGIEIPFSIQDILEQNMTRGELLQILFQEVIKGTTN